jgi:hypothetical protein
MRQNQVSSTDEDREEADDATSYMKSAWRYSGIQERLFKGWKAVNATQCDWRGCFLVVDSMPESKAGV